MSSGPVTWQEKNWGHNLLGYVLVKWSERSSLNFAAKANRSRPLTTFWRCKDTNKWVNYQIILHLFFVSSKTALLFAFHGRHTNLRAKRQTIRPLLIFWCRDNWPVPASHATPSCRWGNVSLRHPHQSVLNHCPKTGRRYLTERNVHPAIEVKNCFLNQVWGMYSYKTTVANRDSGLALFLFLWQLSLDIHSVEITLWRKRFFFS